MLLALRNKRKQEKENQTVDNRREKEIINKPEFELLGALSCNTGIGRTQCSERRLHSDKHNVRHNRLRQKLASRT